MGIYTQKEKELLADDPEVRKRLLSFASMSGKEFFREVQSRLSPEELEERFTRGDKSRHMEGNGLGLSIAKSLTELQNGDMQIVTDGDLFKVVITLPETE